MKTEKGKRASNEEVKWRIGLEGSEEEHECDHAI